MKLSKEELKEKVNGLEIDEETKISLIEDVEDSLEVEPAVDEYKEKYEELREKYKARFLTSDKEDKKEEVEEKEDEVLDIKEI